jgi:2-polyprenyl-3-methyl-5-hydroxy-6-metoxy-1,4-benzoquinol methylase
MTASTQNEGVRVEQAPACYLCGTRGVVLFIDLRDRLFGAPGLWRLLRCPRCGLVWLDPRPVQEEIGKLYSTYYTHETQAPASKRWAPLRKTLKRSLLAASFGYGAPSDEPLHLAVGKVLSWIPPVRDRVGSRVMWLEASRRGRLLDVGAGAGQFLEDMRALGWEVMGLEPDPAAAAAANESVVQGTLEETHIEDSGFDAVTMNHVIEHVRDPIGTLGHCRRVLKDNGRLVVVTPNIESLGRRWFDVAWLHWDPPRHLFLFTPETLRSSVEAAGLEVIELRTSGRDASSAWNASAAIRRQGALPPGSLQAVAERLSFRGLLFSVVENLLLNARPCGEEIVLVATKRA